MIIKSLVLDSDPGYSSAHSDYDLDMMVVQ